MAFHSHMMHESPHPREGCGCYDCRKARVAKDRIAPDDHVVCASCSGTYLVWRRLADNAPLAVHQDNRPCRFDSSCVFRKMRNLG